MKNPIGSISVIIRPRREGFFLKHRKRRNNRRKGKEEKEKDKGNCIVYTTKKFIIKYLTKKKLTKIFNIFYEIYTKLPF